jgi:hypothetical protein
MKESACRFLYFNLRVDKFELNLSEQNGEYAFPNVFCEGFPQADTLAAEEGAIGHRVTSLAIGSQVILGVWVEPFWNEALWCNPLGRVVLKPVYVDNKSLAI